MRRGHRRLRRRRRVAAATLAEAGLDVIVLEAGGHYDRDSYPSDPLEAIASLYRDGGLTIAEGRPPIPVPVGRAVGGTTVINSGTCFRAPDPVLEDWRDRFGIEWASDLAAEFAEAEEFLRVTPLDPERMGRNGQLAMEGAAAIGAERRPDLPQRGQLRAVQLLPVRLRDRRQARHARQLPSPRRRRRGAAAHRGRGAADPGRGGPRGGRALRCRRRRAATTAMRRRYTVRARRATIVAGGALGTPELLLRSRPRRRQVGRNLHIHPACWVGARYEEEVRGWEGVMQSYYVDEWEPQRHPARGDLHAACPSAAPGCSAPGASTRKRCSASADAARSASTSPTAPAGRVGLGGDGSLRATYRLTDEDARRLAFGIARAAEIHFAAGATEVYPNIGRVGVLRPGDLARFEATAFKPAELRLEAFHPMGTARIAADPGEGVCAPDGSVNGVSGLYVADASLFPTSVGVNPMMTVIAFAKRIAAGIAAATPAA